MAKAPATKQTTRSPAPPGALQQNAKVQKSARTSDIHVPATDAERGLIAAIEQDGFFDASALTEAERVVRPMFLRALLLGQIDGRTIPELGLRTFDLVFEDAVNLRYISNHGEALPPLWLDRAHFKAAVALDDARLAMLSLEGARADRGLSLQRIQTQGHVWCDDLQCEGGFNLSGSDIGGQLSLKGAFLKGATDQDGRVVGFSLCIDQAVVKDGVFCGPGENRKFAAEGEFRLLGAEIGGILTLKGAHLKGGTDANGKVVGHAFSADGAAIGGDVFFDSVGEHRFEAEGKVRLLGTYIGGQLSMKGARLKGAVDGDDRVVDDAFSADRAVIKGSVFGTTIEGHRFEAEGAVRLPGADIGGQLALRGARLTGARGPDGRVVGDALAATRVRVASATFLDGGIEVDGAVTFRGAVLSDLDLQGAFQGLAEGAQLALDFRDTDIRRLDVRLGGYAGRGRIHLEGARADTVDSLDAESWGTAPDGHAGGLELDLDGFTYRRAEISTVQRERTRKWACFHARDPVAENVLELLDRGFRGGRPCRKHYSPQPFEQAVKALREVGYSRAADEVAVAKREFHRECQADGRLASLVDLFSLVFFRYGYGPLRASAWTIVLLLLGAAAVWLGQAGDVLVTVVEPGQRVTRCAEIPMSLALDTFLPLVDFGVETRCRVATGAKFGGLAENFRVAYAIVGWLFIPMVALTFSGLLRRD